MGANCCAIDRNEQLLKIQSLEEIYDFLNYQLNRVVNISSQQVVRNKSTESNSSYSSNDFSTYDVMFYYIFLSDILLKLKDIVEIKITENYKDEKLKKNKSVSSNEIFTWNKRIDMRKFVLFLCELFETESTKNLHEIKLLDSMIDERIFM